MGAHSVDCVRTFSTGSPVLRAMKEAKAGEGDESAGVLFGTGWAGKVPNRRWCLGRDLNKAGRKACGSLRKALWAWRRARAA